MLVRSRRDGSTGDEVGHDAMMTSDMLIVEDSEDRSNEPIKSGRRLFVM